MTCSRRIQTFVQTLTCMHLFPSKRKWITHCPSSMLIMPPSLCLSQRSQDTEEELASGSQVYRPQHLERKRTPSLGLCSHPLGRNDMGDSSWMKIKRTPRAVMRASHHHYLQIIQLLSYYTPWSWGVRQLTLEEDMEPPSPEGICTAHHVLIPLLQSETWVYPYGP